MSPQPQKNPILSICIPTYNRPIEFERMFQNLLPQLTDEVEVVVRDDSTNLDTQKIWNQILEKKSFQHQYFKGEKIGLDAANLFSIEKAKGKYIWWFSDDDVMRPGAVDHILKVVKTHPDISFIWVNFDYAKASTPAVIRDEGFFQNGDEVLTTVGVNIGLLSSLLFDREKALPALEKARQHVVGFSFAGLVPIFHVITGEGRSYFLKGPYVLCHPTTNEEIRKVTTRNGVVKNEGFNVYGVDFYRIVNAFRGRFSDQAIRKILTVNFASLWRGMLVGWVGGWDTPKGKIWRMFRLYWSFPEFWIALPCFLMPLWVNQLLYKVYKVFFHQRRFVLFNRADQNSKP